MCLLLNIHRNIEIIPKEVIEKLNKNQFKKL